MAACNANCHNAYVNITGAVVTQALFYCNELHCYCYYHIRSGGGSLQYILIRQIGFMDFHLCVKLFTFTAIVIVQLNINTEL